MPIDHHEFDEDGDHVPDECAQCIEQNHSCVSSCDCGNCCRQLILEAEVRDAIREPRIAQECRPLRDIGPDVVGYILNDRENGLACHFLDQQTNLCTIYETRPLMCRVFNCDQAKQDPDSPLSET